MTHPQFTIHSTLKYLKNAQEFRLYLFKTNYASIETKQVAQFRIIPHSVYYAGSTVDLQYTYDLLPTEMDMFHKQEIIRIGVYFMYFHMYEPNSQTKLYFNQLKPEMSFMKSSEFCEDLFGLHIVIDNFLNCDEILDGR
jgi:hypothetical protein